MTILRSNNSKVTYRTKRQNDSPAWEKTIISVILIVLINCFILYRQGVAQTGHRVRITGRVTNFITGAPIHNVNVFLINTTRGAATDEQGMYSIENIPLGNYEIVASMIGYEVESLEIRLVESIDKTFNFQLRSKVIMAPPIEVEANSPRLWKGYLKEFQKTFLGTSSNSSKTQILNPEVLDFIINEESVTLSASSDQPLQIVNRALGYRSETHLVSFSSGYANGVDKYVHKSRFQVMPPKDEKERKNWEKNRLKTYRGSQRHFFAALIAGKHEEEGFKVYNVSEMSNSNVGIFVKKVSPEDILFPGDRPFEKKLSFSNYLKVIYTKERVSNEYIHSMRLERNTLISESKDRRQISWIKMEHDTTIVNIQGHIYNSFALTTYGYWAWERFADVLPLDYH